LVDINEKEQRKREKGEQSGRKIELEKQRTSQERVQEPRIWGRMIIFQAFLSFIHYIGSLS